MTDFNLAILDRVKPGALVVSGSRGLIGYHNFAQHVCKLAKDRGWCIVVGDARGVDTCVIRMAGKQNVPLVVLGCQAVGCLRLTPPESARSQLILGGSVKGSCFIIRDKALAELASTTDHNGFIGLWDGQSKGTRKTATFCQEAGIPGLLMRPNGKIAERWERTHV